MWRRIFFILISIVIFFSVYSNSFCQESESEVKIEDGVINGSPFRIVIPKNWNKGLVMYAHGYMVAGSKWKPDEVLDDLALIITTPHGLIVILGCAHRGAINTIYHAQKMNGMDTVYMVLGGSHLIGSDSGPQIQATIEALKKLDAQKVGMSHCTGLPASVEMAQELGERFFFNNAGTVIDVE